ncbi:hypothetical protein NDN08_005436 [Rhodosorus marinus]|uniref:Exocyst component Exo84 C-terminal domain-containing protein n=1 Tax=Rhodosorus marinus TaxID=101924 RepID=A0AAV8V3U2_9RHOD|nr:hypothetical protein NDN08_005436 [Rhodosorus marinus]
MSKADSRKRRSWRPFQRPTSERRVSSKEIDRETDAGELRAQTTELQDDIEEDAIDILTSGVESFLLDNKKSSEWFSERSCRTYPKSALVDKSGAFVLDDDQVQMLEILDAGKAGSVHDVDLLDEKLENQLKETEKRLGEVKALHLSTSKSIRKASQTSSLDDHPAESFVQAKQARVAQTVAEEEQIVLSQLDFEIQIRELERAIFEQSFEEAVRAVKLLPGTSNFTRLEESVSNRLAIAREVLLKELVARGSDCADPTPYCLRLIELDRSSTACDVFFDSSSGRVSDELAINPRMDPLSQYWATLSLRFIRLTSKVHRNYQKLHAEDESIASRFLVWFVHEVEIFYDKFFHKLVCGSGNESVHDVCVGFSAAIDGSEIEEDSSVDSSVREIFVVKLSELLCEDLRRCFALERARIVSELVERDWSLANISLADMTSAVEGRKSESSIVTRTCAELSRELLELLGGVARVGRDDVLADGVDCVVFCLKAYVADGKAAEPALQKERFLMDRAFLADSLVPGLVSVLKESIWKPALEAHSPKQLELVKRRLLESID